MLSEDVCPFCVRISELGVAAGAAIQLPDGFPVSDGHTLVVPTRHCADLFDLSDREYAAVWQVVRVVRDSLVERLHPDGFTIGANVGLAGGQTVTHAHVHVIPRFTGDVADPRGGVRWVIPKRAAYWDTAG